jgi:hypothetical protein
MDNTNKTKKKNKKSKKGLKKQGSLTKIKRKNKFEDNNEDVNSKNL